MPLLTLPRYREFGTDPLSVCRLPDSLSLVKLDVTLVFLKRVGEYVRAVSSPQEEEK
jgi:hypothetical protein